MKFPLAYDNGAYSPAAAVAAKRAAVANAGPKGSSDPMLARGDDIAKMVGYWDKTAAIIDGIEAMREAGALFLPKFTDEEAEEHESRLKLTKMTNVFRDIVESLAAKPFERNVKIDEDGDPLPELISNFDQNVDGAGLTLTAFANLVFFNGIANAIDWIMVDAPTRDPSIRTLADMKAKGVRPYWSRVLGYNVIRATSKVIDGIECLTFIRIYEPGETDHIREFERNPDGTVVWRLFAETDKVDPKTMTKFVQTDEGMLSIGRIPMVPFATGRRDGRTWRYHPSLQDAADLQIELYQQESGLKFAKTLTAYPMLSGNGIKPEKTADGKSIKKIRVGPNRVLYAPPDGGGNAGSWSYVEPSAESLKFLAADIEGTIKELRELGRQPLTVQSSNLTSITTQVAAGKAKSAVKQWGIVLKLALTEALKLTAQFVGVDTSTVNYDVDIFLEFDEFFDDKSLDSLGKDRDRGDLSRESYWEEMRRRGIYRQNFDPEEEKLRLLSEVPSDGTTPIDPAPPVGG